MTERTQIPKSSVKRIMKLNTDVKVVSAVCLVHITFEAFVISLLVGSRCCCHKSDRIIHWTFS